MLPGLVSLSELAARWGISKESVLRYHIPKGGLRAIAGGNTSWFRIDEVARYEELLKRDWRGKIKLLARRLKRIEGTPLVAA